jgi:TRAP-type mannitol/chloroaromatic compound transport system permease small subunit
MKTIASFLESINIFIGKAVGWLTLLMVLGTFTTVVLRHFLDTGSIKLQESVIYMHGTVFMLSIAYTYAQDEHVRVDIFYRNFSTNIKRCVDIAGNLLLLLPVSLFIFWMSYSYVESSWRIGEGSSEAGGLAGLYLLKTTLLAMPALLIIQAIANSLLNLSRILNNEPELVGLENKESEL